MTLRYKWQGMGRALALALALFGISELSTAATSSAVVATGVVPVADFFRAPLMECPKLNRTGTHLVALSFDQDDHQVAILCDLATGEKQVIKGGGDRDIYEATWLDDYHVLLAQSEGKRYADGMFVADTRNKKSTYVVERNSVAELIGVPRSQPLHPVVWFVRDAYRRGNDSGLATIDAGKSMDEDRDRTGFMTAGRVPGNDTSLADKPARVLETYPELPAGTPSSFIAGADGEPAFVIMGEKGQYTLHRLTKTAWEECPVDLDVNTIIAAGDTPGEIWAATSREEAKPKALVRINAESGDVIETVYQDAEYDCMDVGLIRHPDSGKIVGLRLVRTGLATVWLDQGFAELQNKIERLFPDMTVVVDGLDSTVERFVVTAYSDVSPSAYFLVDLSKGRVNRLASTAPWIEPSHMRPRQRLNYKARDGVSVSGYLTLPAGASKEAPAPLVVLPHGGPWARDAWGWDGEVQFLASRGYAVFQPNYRGSTGSQWRFPQSDRWAFQKMSSDVTDGVKKLLKTGLIDPQRVAIMGSSFGGYLAVSGAVDEPALYHCAITVSGVFDWSLMISSSRSNINRSSLQFEYLMRGLGDPRKEEEKFAALSPLTRLDRVKIPFFVAHGRGDEVVDYNQSKHLVSELKKRGIPCESLFKRGEGHGMARVEDRVELYTAIETFLAKNLRKAPAAVAVVGP